MLMILIISITLSEALGQFLLSVSHKNKLLHKKYFGPIPSNLLPFITWALYGICTFLLLKSYEFTTMGNAEVYWDALSALIVPLIGVIYFRTKINIIGWTGIFLIAVGTIMLGYEEYLIKFL
jgi:multidrug transporter EmrE-like cation transporter